MWLEVFRLGFAVGALVLLVMYARSSARDFRSYTHWVKWIRFGVGFVLFGAACGSLQLAQSGRSPTFGTFVMAAGFLLGIVGYAGKAHAEK